MLMYFGETAFLTWSWEKNCYEASVNPEFGSTLARRLNQSCFPAVLQSNQITIKFGTAEARRLNCALKFFRIFSNYRLPGKLHFTIFH